MEKITIRNHLHNNCKSVSLLILIFMSVFFQNTFAGDSVLKQQKSPITIEILQHGKTNFATILNESHNNNRIGYRFHEHEPISYGKVPLSDIDANIDKEKIRILEERYNNSDDVIIHKEEIEKNESWSRQDWTFYLKPVSDGVEILLIISTYDEGLPEYYGIQQCFRMSGSSNAEWRKKIANTPAFSEYDLWDNQSAEAEKTSLTYVLRNNEWQAVPAGEETTGARTPLGFAIDDVRTNGNLMSKVGPYKAFMLDPVDNGLITRTDLSGLWLSGMYWQNTSHLTNHHPADCLHSIVNIGNIPPYSKRAILGKIYWFQGNKDSLYNHYKRDFLDGDNRNRLVLASCQFPVSGNIRENASWIKNQMKHAKIRGADIVHFPECALSGYGGKDVDDYSGFDWNGLRSETESIMVLAKKIKLWAVVGSSHRLSSGNKLHNSLYVINSEGRIIDRYDKRFCTGGDLKYYTPGDHFVIFDINNVKCGLLICYDIRFPELFREYRKLGTDVIFHSFYNARQKQGSIHPVIMPVTGRARAATNYFFVSLTNSSAPYSWPCYFITPDGLVKNSLEADKPGILISEVDISKKYYDASKPYRMDAINGKLNSGETVDDPRSLDRETY